MHLQLPSGKYRQCFRDISMLRINRSQFKDSCSSSSKGFQFFSFLNKYQSSLYHVNHIPGNNVFTIMGPMPIRFCVVRTCSRGNCTISDEAGKIRNNWANNKTVDAPISRTGMSTTQNDRWTWDWLMTKSAETRGYSGVGRKGLMFLLCYSPEGYKLILIIVKFRAYSPRKSTSSMTAFNRHNTVVELNNFTCEWPTRT